MQREQGQDSPRPSLPSNGPISTDSDTGFGDSPARARHQSYQINPDRIESMSFRLDLFRAPALVGLAHVGRGLNGRDELQDQVADTGDAYNRGGNLAQDVVV